MCSGQPEKENKPLLKVAVISDYICPFCYFGFLRLEKLRERYELGVNWVLVEIHPENPAEGKPVEQLGYPRAKLDLLLDELDVLARAEGVVLRPHTFTTNSRKALLLAEAAKTLGAEVFYRLHYRLFESFFVEGQNIGDALVLGALAAECNIPAEIVEQAWNDAIYSARLDRNQAAAVQGGATATPTFFIGEQRLTGAVPTESLLIAARKLTSRQVGA